MCYVQSRHSDVYVYLPVPRTGKRITLAASIGTHGSYLKPLIVIPRKSYDADLALTGITNKKLDIYSQNKRYTDRSIFLAWVTELFLPEVARRRQAFAYEGQMILIMDNCTGRIKPEIDEACAVHGFVICPLPPHSSNQIQPLGVSTFGMTKRRIARARHMEKVNVEFEHIAQVVSSFMSAASPANVVGTFLSAEITLFLGTDGRLYCRVCPDRARCPIVRTDPSQEPEPTDENVDKLEKELYLEHYVDKAGEGIPSESE